MKADLAGLLRYELKIEIADLRSEMKSDMQVLHRELIGLHRDLNQQTLWILAAMLAAAMLYPVVAQIVGTSMKILTGS